LLSIQWRIALSWLVENIARREGFGNILAEGVKKAAETIGKGSNSFAVEVKGVDVPMHEPRGKKAVGIMYATAARGAVHTDAAHDPGFEQPNAVPELGLVKPSLPCSRAYDRKDTREHDKIWTAKLKTIQRIFQESRARIAETTKNPRLKRISFHTFRHWKATMEYHKTKDILHVMRVLGHRSISNTLRYTQLLSGTEDEYVSKVAHTVEEACSLVESGYEYVTEFADQGIKIFRRRK
jgi:hypothetical protein